MTVDKPIEDISPRQKLSRSKKGKDWGIQNVENIIRMAGMSNLIYSNDKINYDLYNNIIDRKDFTYVTNPYGLSEELPAKLNNYNIITPKLKLLEGEEIKRPFNFRVAAVNADAVSQIEEKRKQLLLQYLEAELIAELQAQGIQVQNPETGETMTPEEIEKYMNYSDADIRESIANKIAKYLRFISNPTGPCGREKDPVVDITCCALQALSSSARQNLIVYLLSKIVYRLCQWRRDPFWRPGATNILAPPPPPPRRAPPFLVVEEQNNLRKWHRRISKAPFFSAFACFFLRI